MLTICASTTDVSLRRRACLRRPALPTMPSSPRCRSAPERTSMRSSSATRPDSTRTKAVRIRRVAQAVPARGPVSRERIQGRGLLAPAARGQTEPGSGFVLPRPHRSTSTTNRPRSCSWSTGRTRTMSCLGTSKVHTYIRPSSTGAARRPFERYSRAVPTRICEINPAPAPTAMPLRRGAHEITKLLEQFSAQREQVTDRDRAVGALASGTQGERHAALRPEPDLLVRAARRGDQEEVARLLAAGVEVNAALDLQRRYIRLAMRATLLRCA